MLRERLWPFSLFWPSLWGSTVTLPKHTRAVHHFLRNFWPCEMRLKLMSMPQVCRESRINCLSTCIRRIILRMSYYVCSVGGRGIGGHRTQSSGEFAGYSPQLARTAGPWFRSWVTLQHAGRQALKPTFLRKGSPGADSHENRFLAATDIPGIPGPESEIYEFPDCPSNPVITDVMAGRRQLRRSSFRRHVSWPHSVVARSREAKFVSM